MNRILLISFIIATLVLAALISGAAIAQGEAATQDQAETQEQTASQPEAAVQGGASSNPEFDDRFGLLPVVDLEFYVSSSDKNQDNVRQYDGHSYGFAGIGTLRLDGYYDNLWFSYWGQDLFIGDSNNRFRMNFDDILSLKIDARDLTHRLAPVPLVDPVQPGDFFNSLDPNRGFQIQRNIQEYRLGITPPGVDWLRLAGEVWHQSQEGSQQLLFRSRSNRQRYQGRQLIDRSTTETYLGVDLGSWNQVMNYRYYDRHFDENAPSPTYPSVDTLVPIKVIVPNTRTVGNIFESRDEISRIMRKWIDPKGQGTWVTEYFSTKSRSNRSASSSIKTAEAPVKNEDLPYDPSVKIRRYNLAVTHLHGQHLMITGRFKHLNYDNRTPVLFSDGEPLNQVVDRHSSAYQVDSTYTGIERVTLRGGYEYRLTRRDIEPIHEVHEEFSHGPIATTSRQNIFNVGFTSRPFDWATFQLRSRAENTNEPVFSGSPGRRWDLSSDLTLNLSENTIFLATYSHWRDVNTKIADPVAIPINDPNFPLIRDAQGGAQYHNRVQTWDLGVWSSPLDWFSLDVHAGRYDVHSRAYWVLGTDPTFLPIIEQPEYVPQNVRNLYLSGSGTVRITPRLRFRFDMMHSDSRGQTTTYSLYSKVPNQAQRVYKIRPVDVRNSRDAIGLEYQLTRDFRVLLEQSWENWRDHIDEDNSGRFKLFSVEFWYKY